MGVPVVSLCGDRHASRVAHTLAHQAGAAWVRCASDTAAFVQQVTEIVESFGGLPRVDRLGADEKVIALQAQSFAETSLGACP